MKLGEARLGAIQARVKSNILSKPIPLYPARCLIMNTRCGSGIYELSRHVRVRVALNLSIARIMTITWDFSLKHKIHLPLAIYPLVWANGRTCGVKFRNAAVLTEIIVDMLVFIGASNARQLPRKKRPDRWPLPSAWSLAIASLKFHPFVWCRT